jgi:hypothetical protein
MQSERQREANEYRAEGAEQAQGIRARADTRVAPSSWPRRPSSRRSCAARAMPKASKIYADAFGQDVDFFNFYRSLEAYRTAFGPDTTMVLSPDQRVLPIFRSAQGGEGGRPMTPEALRDLWTALALVLVIEGALYALFPQPMTRWAPASSSIRPATS